MSLKDVKSGQTAIPVKHLDIKAMSEAEYFMLEDLAEARWMGLAARDWALDLMNPEKLTHEQRLIFIELIKNQIQKDF